MIIALNEGKLNIRFRVNEDQTVELVNFSPLAESLDLPLQAARAESGFFAPFKPHQFLAAHVASTTWAACRRSGGMWIIKSKKTTRASC